MNNTNQKIELVKCNGCGAMIDPREAEYSIDGEFVYCINCVDWDGEKYDGDDSDCPEYLGWAIDEIDWFVLDNEAEGELDDAIYRGIEWD